MYPDFKKVSSVMLGASFDAFRSLFLLSLWRLKSCPVFSCSSQGPDQLDARLMEKWLFGSTAKVPPWFNDTHWGGLGVSGR